MNKINIFGIELDLPIFILICAGIAIVLFIILFILIKYVFYRNRIKKQVRDIERKYSFLNNLIIGQDSQYIKRLEVISRTNLLYSDTYNTYSEKFKKIYDVDDRYALGVLNELKERISSRKYKGIKKVLNEGKKALDILKRNTVELDKELSKLIKPEEDARTSILKVKEAFRVIKQNYASKQEELLFCASTFETVFNKLDKKFAEYDYLIESAEYDEATAMIPTISNVITELGKVLDKMPGYVSLVTNIIPNKIKALKEEEQQMLEQDYPLYHLLTSKTYEKFNEKLMFLQKKVKNLSIDGIDDEYNKLEEEIEQLHLQFAKEVRCEKYVNENLDSTYKQMVDVEKSFIKLYAILPEMNRVYKISSEDNERITNLQREIDDLTNLRRLLDTYLHSATKQPYSIVCTKLEDLKRDLDKSVEGVNNFKIFLESLKSISEEAFTLVYSFYYQTKNIEANIASLNVAATSDKYKNKFALIYNYINTINTLINQIPIDINEVSKNVEEVKSLAEVTFQYANEDYSNAQLAESSIIFANRDRHRQNDFHTALKAYEARFFNGEFDSVYKEVCKLLSQLRDASENSKK